VVILFALTKQEGHGMSRRGTVLLIAGTLLLALCAAVVVREGASRRRERAEVERARLEVERARLEAAREYDRRQLVLEDWARSILRREPRIPETQTWVNVHIGDSTEYAPTSRIPGKVVIWDARSGRLVRGIDSELGQVAAGSPAEVGTIAVLRRCDELGVGEWVGPGSAFGTPHYAERCFLDLVAVRTRSVILAVWVTARVDRSSRAATNVRLDTTGSARDGMPPRRLVSQIELDRLSRFIGRLAGEASALPGLFDWGMPTVAPR
jgi:hypothetical protein